MVSKSRGNRPRGSRTFQGGVIFNLEEHAGKWVATQRGQILAVAKTLDELEAALDKVGVGNDVVLTRVPTSGDFAL